MAYMRPQPKEHAGGALPQDFQRVPVQWNEANEPIPIAIVQPALPADKPHEIFADILLPLLGERAGVRAVAAIAKAHAELMAVELAAARAEATAAVLTVLVDEEDRLATALAFAAGLPCAQVKSGTQWAEHFGVKKQAWNQQVEKLRQRFKIKSRTMRDEEARQHMSEAYWSRKKAAGR